MFPRHPARWLALAVAVLVLPSPARAVNYVWNTAASGNWNVGANWNPAAVPTGTDNATITAAGTYQVSLTDAREVNNLTLNSANATLFQWTSAASMTLNGTATLNAGRWLAGGLMGSPSTITGGTITRAANGTGTLQMEGDLRLVNAQVNGNLLRFNPASGSRLRLSGTAGILPGGVVSLVNPVVYASNSGITFESPVSVLDNVTVNLGFNTTLGAAGGVNLTLGANAVVQYHDVNFVGPSVVGREFYDGNGGLVTLNNQGTIRCTGGELYVGRFFDTANSLPNVAVTNTGLIEATAGVVTVHNNTFTNGPVGVVRATNGGQVFLFAYDWVNQGTFEVGGNNSDFLMGGRFTRAGMGTITRTGTNTVGFYAARMDNSGGTFALTAATGNYILWGQELFGGAEIVGGAITATGGAKLEVRVIPGGVTGVDYNRLTDVDVGAGVLTFPSNYGKLILRGTSTLAAGDTLTLAGNFTELAFAQTRQLDNLTVVLAGDGSRLSAQESNTLTLGPTTLVRKTGTGTAALGNYLLLDTSGTTTLINRGTVRVEQGTLQFTRFNNQVFTNEGVIQVDAGATLSGQNLVTNGGTVRGAGTVAASVTFAGTGNHLRPGDSGTAATGRLSVTGNVTLTAGTTATFRLNGATAVTGHDQLAVTGTVDLGGATLATALGYAPSTTDLLFLVTNDGTDAVTGTFTGAPNNSLVTVGGYTARISYFGDSATAALIGGNDVVLYNFTPVPEPAAVGVLAGLAAGLAAGRRSRRPATPSAAG
jgi:hypothetical protein